MFARLFANSQRLSSRCAPQRTRSLIDVGDIRARATQLQDLTDRQLTARSLELRDAPADKTETFALATEAVRRATGRTYYDVQLQAGRVLADGDLAEMQTGEGKTLVTLLPVYDAVVHGHNVHVATTNSYLAERDCAELKPAFELLGVSISLLPEENSDTAKQAAYQCDVTYGTGYEFGFDYLRDQLTLRQQPQDALGDAWIRSLSNTPRSSPQLVQSARRVTIIDEIDSVLIDEANTPLVISFFTSDKPNIEPYRLAAAAADTLTDGVDYGIDVTAKQVTISQHGSQHISALKPVNVTLQRPWRIYVEHALRARYLLQRDVDYVVQGGKVALVDQHTGRIFPDRKLRDGLHQAIEFLEAADLTAETNSFARISRQRFFQQYVSGTGMTGTATDAIDEFQRFFSLKVVPIPLNRPSQRVMLPNRFFGDANAKYEAIVADVATRHRVGQPILIGTRTIEQSRQVSEMLTAKGLTHQLLNGMQDAEEAAIVALAGQPAAITVATNMAGRGTDIKLTPASRDAGGLHVIAAEPNRSHRVDRQLIGRAARQGDPGSCQMFVSADDDLLKTMGRSLVRKISATAGRGGEAELNAQQELRNIQRQAEYVDFMQRQQLMQQDLWAEDVLQTLVGQGVEKQASNRMETLI